VQVDGTNLCRLGLLALESTSMPRAVVFWVLCAIALAWSFSQQQTAAIVDVLARLRSVPEEHDANCVLSYTFSLDRVLEHPAIDALFEKLQRAGEAPEATLGQWRQMLRNSYIRERSVSRIGQPF
jgi:hypothetical protein